MRNHLSVRVRTQTGTKFRAFELADGVVLLIYQATREFHTIPAAN